MITPGPVRISDADVAAYIPLVEKAADQLHREGSYVWRDDLVQEGMIAVWEQLSDGQVPNNIDVSRRMLKWIRKEKRRGGRDTKRVEVVPYDPALEE